MKRVTVIEEISVPAMTAGLTRAGFRATIAEVLASASLDGRELPRIAALYCAIRAGLIRQESHYYG